MNSHDETILIKEQTGGSAKWWHRVDGERIQCDLCPRECILRGGDRGFCFVRQNVNGQLVLTAYGRSTGFCVDPIEKKPLNHFLPGTSVLSFGTAGCNLGCQFCQNWSISKSKEVADLSEHASPEKIARAAVRFGCKSVAFTYNDPIIWAEYAIDTAEECHKLGVKTVAVTNGYISQGARKEFFSAMDAVNVDLKAFTEHFYRRLTLAHLDPVLDTLCWLKNESTVWLEVTNLIIPGENDSPLEIKRMCDWIITNLGDEVPLHFSAFFPDFRLTDHPPTPTETLLRARKQAMLAGLKYVYIGNVIDPAAESTFCSRCKKLLIERTGYKIGQFNLNKDRCRFCNNTIPGCFQESKGDWGNLRMLVQP